MKTNQPFIIIPFHVLQVKQLRHTAKIVYGYLVFKQANRGYWEGWIKQISHETGIPYRTVQRDLRQLGAIGYIKILQYRTQDNNSKKWRTFTKYIMNR